MVELNEDQPGESLLSVNVFCWEVNVWVSDIWRELELLQVTVYKKCYRKTSDHVTCHLHHVVMFESVPPSNAVLVSLPREKRPVQSLYCMKKWQFSHFPLFQSRDRIESPIAKANESQ